MVNLRWQKPFIYIAAVSALVLVIGISLIEMVNRALQLENQEQTIPNWKKIIIINTLRFEAILGNASAQARLAFIYSMNFFGNDYLDENKARYWAEKAVDQDEVVAYAVLNLVNDYKKNALNELNKAFGYKEYVSAKENKDLKEKIYWLEKAVAAGNIYAANDLSIYYSKGEGVEKNPAKAIELLKSAALKGDYMAMYNLGLKFSNLNHDSNNTTPLNYAAAKDWYKKSLKIYPNYCAANDLGILYAQAKGVPQNSIKALSLFRQAAAIFLIDNNIPYNNVMNTEFADYQLAQYAKINIAIEKTNTTKMILKSIKQNCW